MQQESPLLTLPEDLLLHVLAFLSVQEFAISQLVCRSFRVAVSSSERYTFILSSLDAAQPLRTVSAGGSLFRTPKLVFDRCRALGDSWAESLCATIRLNPYLKSLSLRGCTLTERSMPLLSEAVAECRSLKLLNISWNKIGPQGLKYLSKGALHLRVFCLEECGIGDEGCEYLAKSLKGGKGEDCCLKELNMDGNNIGSRGASILCKALQKSKLQTLNFSNNPIGPSSGQELANMLLSQSHLKALLLHKCGLGDDGLGALSSGLKAGSKSLETLDISSNDITDVGILSLAEVLEDTSLPLKRVETGGNLCGWREEDAIQQLLAFKRI
mmetsp:Transcript_18755/g.30833  ORF Transcript_18755/g.30833 Transcript_18755/m.30833 type:complete len:327 (+) Transcript_18755:91-1071(+)|eukprot:CAMPEP_0184674476 /NCGR_PEP_ID=MMETSP0308-20130426/87257_1 /TAXON_ID=38269 /ORGANISM="Gloeochaete witrockiana, Strain SAG 46.84" /LENGTH=326 /DNA_ID=CAMNT_0027122079 /DNA_START=81 /DNA_END=1061 /DNA_ORIENTATION=-